MTDFLITSILGAVIIVMGVINMLGNISTLHRYHRSRVSPEDIRPFGRMVGFGTILCGAGLILFSVASFIASSVQIPALTVVGGVVLAVLMAVGLIISLLAIKKYNHGIF